MHLWSNITVASIPRLAWCLHPSGSARHPDSFHTVALSSQECGPPSPVPSRVANRLIRDRHGLQDGISQRSCKRDRTQVEGGGWKVVSVGDTLEGELQDCRDGLAVGYADPRGTGMIPTSLTKHFSSYRSDCDRQ